MTRRWKPKEWARPRSYRSRDAAAMRRLGLSQGDLVTMILKTLYPQSRISGGPERKRPTWAELAYQRKWITFSEYHAVEEELTGRVLPGRYAPSPMFAMLRKGDA